MAKRGSRTMHGMTAPANLVLIGPMGAGKSAIGRALSPQLGLPFVDADAAIEAATGASIGAIFDCEGESGFRRREQAMLARLLAESGRIVATGGGAVLDPANRQLLRSHGLVLHLHADVPTQLRRLQHDRSRPLLRRPDREAALHALAGTRDALYAQTAHLRFDTSGQTRAATIKQLLRLLQPYWPRLEASA